MAKIKLTPALPVSDKKKIKLTPAVPVEEKESDAIDTALDFSYGAAQGATFNLADEGYGAARALLERGGGSPKEFGELYEEHRDAARHQWDVARERSPIATTTGEITGAVVSPTSKILAAGKGLKGMVRGAAEGGLQSYGATEKEGLKDQLIDSGKGSVIGGATGAVTNLITKRFAKSPNATRAEVLGVKPKDYRVDGPGDRKQIVERINNTGMLKNRKMEYDVDKMAFVPRGKSKFELDDLEMNTEERLLGRAQDAVEKLQHRKEQYFGPLLDNRFVSSMEVDQMAKEIAEEYAKRGLLKGAFSRQQAADKIRENIDQFIMMEDGDLSRLSLRQLDALKRAAQEDVRNFSKGLGELGDNDELARITARKLKNLVEDRIGVEEFKKINSAQHDFLTVSGDLQNKIKGLELAAPARQHLEKTNAIEGVLDSFLGGSQGRLDAAARKEWWQGNVPEPVRAVIPYALEETPGAVYRQRFQGQEMQGNWRNPSSVPNIPEQLIRTPLPRTTDGLMQNKKFVLAKVAQQAPEMFDAVQDVFENDPEQLPQLAAVIAQRLPHFFERDKYNRFDGRIMNEQDKHKAIKDTLGNESLSTIEQAKIISRLEKEGIYEH